MTDYVETRSGLASRYAEYVQRGGKNGYEIEHIWANHPEHHEDEFAHPADFDEYRNRIGGLLLLPKSFNASYGDLPYAEKRDHYFGQNLLARSLHEQAYEHNPGFRRFREESGLPFTAHADFKKADLDARQDLYRQSPSRSGTRRSCCARSRKQSHSQSSAKRGAPVPRNPQPSAAALGCGDGHGLRSLPW